MVCEILEAVRAAKNDWKLKCTESCEKNLECPFAGDDKAFPPTKLPPVSENVFVLQNLPEDNPIVVLVKKKG
jgi:hypothetical protein